MRNSFGTVVEVQRSSPADAILEQQVEAPALGGNHIIAKVSKFALTANNATYALFGEAMGYYSFFPASAADRGIVPVWGFATVEQSNVDGVSPGTRLYGFWPFASHVTLQPDRISQHGFIDGAPHRQQLPGIYNAAAFASADPFCSGDDTLVPALKPLFTTAWVLEDFFASNALFGAQSLILSSASSKTALATAHCVKDAARLPGQLIGLTSQRNAGFVTQTGLYDMVLTYEEIGALPHGPTVLVDFAGNPAVLGSVHTHYGDALKYSCQVGKSHSGSPMPTEALPGPTPTLFFAPDHALDAAKRLGQDAFGKALFARWQGFQSQASDWFNVTTVQGLENAIEVYKRVISGDIEGSDVFIVEP